MLERTRTVPSPDRGARALLIGLALSAPVAAAPRQDPCAEETAEFRVLDRVAGPYVDLGVVPIRPLALGRRDLGGGQSEPAVYVLNTHDSKLEIFSETPSGNGPDEVIQLPWAPVAIVFWEKDPENPAKDELLITFNGTYSLARMKASGEMIAFIRFEEAAPGPQRLLAEPSDILLDAGAEPPRAFVSCPGSHAVVQVDLGTNKIARVYDEEAYSTFRVTSPTSMAFDRNGRVLVAPLHSGNNTLAEARIEPPPGGTPGVGIDAADQVLSLGTLDETEGGLPDEDLFRIDPDANGGAGSVTAVGWDAGTTIFAIDRNKFTNEVWQLGTEADNADPNRQTEPDIQGDFIDNQISISKPRAVRSNFESLQHITYLDGIANPVGQPCAVAFSADDGDALVIGLLTDNMVRLDKDGFVLTGGWDLRPTPQSAPRIPRGVVLSSTEEYAFVYLWGTNELAKVHVDPPGLPDATQYYPLSHDPTPPMVKAGRGHFYDGSNSGPGTLSCASCHINGRSDLLMWNLSEGPQDDKGPMLTQTLVGLEKLGPFHWRGERTLEDFNPAFDGLLGGTELSESEFDEFEAFVFSLQNPANPNQHRDRIIDNSITARGVMTANAVCGQERFFEDDPGIFRGRMSCNECHFLPTGTVGDMFPDSDDTRPRRSWRKVAPFHELWRRDMSPFSVDVLASVPGPETYARLGAGMSHSGLVPTLRDFVAAVNGVMPNTTTDEEDISSFLHQLDQGIAPAAHRAYWIHPGNHDGAEYAELSAYLLTQALDGNCGIAVYGESFLPSSTVASVRWSWDPVEEEFVPDHPQLAPQQLDFFADQAELHGLENVFVAMPPGMSDRWAIDYDMDGLVNGTDPDPWVTETQLLDQTPPAFDVDPHVVWIAGNVARIAWRTDDPSSYEIEATTPNLPPVTVSSDRRGTSVSALVTPLRFTTPVDPSGPPGSGTPRIYEFDIEVTNKDGQSFSYPLSDRFPDELGPQPIQTEPYLRDEGNNASKEHGQTIVVDCMQWEGTTGPLSGDAVHFDGRVRIRFKFDLPSGSPGPEARAVVASVVRVKTNDPTDTEVLGFNDVVRLNGTGMFATIETPHPTLPSGVEVFAGSSGGPYLVAPATVPAGGTGDDFTTVFSFQADVAADEKLLLVIENVFPLDPDPMANAVVDFNNDVNAEASTTLEIPTPTTRSDHQRWSFPDSPVDRLEWPLPAGQSPMDCSTQ